MKWILPSIVTAFLWASKADMLHYDIEYGNRFKLLYILGSFAYFIVGLMFLYYIKIQDKFIKLKDLKLPDKKKLLLIGGFCINVGYKLKFLYYV